MSDAAVTDDELQTLYDGIPAHAAHPMQLSVTGGVLTLQGTLDRRSARGPAVDQVHGGVIAALLDTAATLALVAGEGESWSTVDLRVDYLRPVRIDTCRLEAEVLRAGKRAARSTAKLFDNESRLCATAIGTFVR